MPSGKPRAYEASSNITDPSEARFEIAAGAIPVVEPGLNGARPSPTAVRFTNGESLSGLDSALLIPVDADNVWSVEDLSICFFNAQRKQNAKEHEDGNN